eukprot:2645339-Rhodomonas_salina.2
MLTPCAQDVSPFAAANKRPSVVLTVPLTSSRARDGDLPASLCLSFSLLLLELHLLSVSPTEG